MLHYFPVLSKWKANLQTHICYIVRSDELPRHFLASLCVLNSPLPLPVVKLCLLFSLVLWTSARNPSRSFRQHGSKVDLCSQWRSPQHRRPHGKTLVKYYCGWSRRPWPLLSYHLNRRPALESKWTFMPKSEEIHPNWCGHIPGDWMNSVNLTSDLPSLQPSSSLLRGGSFSLLLLHSTIFTSWSSDTKNTTVLKKTASLTLCS